MYSVILLVLLSNIFYFSLHVTNNASFPKPLSTRKEKECLELIKKGDIAAKNKLIEHNLRLVAHIIKKYYSKVKDQEDLISIGTVGLIKAVSSFDYTKGIRFATYASRCIENEILMHFRSQKKLVKDVYISDPIDTDKEGNCLTLMDVVADDKCIAENIDLALEIEKMYLHIENNLDDREKSIIKMRYGLHGVKPLTQREVAKTLNISRSYVSRIEKKALICLNKSLSSEGFYS